MLEHIGGSPALALVNRGKVSVANYDRLTKWLGVGYRYFEKYGVPKIPPGDREKFEKAAASFKPLVLRLDSTTRDMLLPALADGQIGVVLDTKLSSKQFAQALPATETPLRMLEPALVLGVSDAELLRKACTEYKSIINDMIDAARQIEGSEIPADFRLPDAVLKSNKKKGYTLFTYPLPEAWGVDTHVLPNAGLSAERGGRNALPRAQPQAAGRHAADRGGPAHPHRPAAGRRRRRSTSPASSTPSPPGSTWASAPPSRGMRKTKGPSAGRP